MLGNRFQRRAHKRSLALLPKIQCEHYRPTNTGEDLVQILSITAPTPLKNDPEERWKSATTTTRLMSWLDADTIQELAVDDALLAQESQHHYRIRAVKPWPDIEPVYYELHLDRD